MISSFLNLLSNSSNNTPQQKLQTLRGQLYNCTYPNNVKFLIEKICMNIMQQYPAFSTQILAFVQNNQQRRFIQIGGKFAYQYKGKMRAVKIYMMFNQFFPQKSPYLRILNVENDEVNKHYSDIKSHNDPQSYVLNKKLSKLSTWNPASDCVSIFAQAKYYLQTYPFYQSDLLNSAKQQKKNQIFAKKQTKEVQNRGSYYQSNQNQKKNETKETQDDYNAKQCKLCYNNLSNMINLSCAHVMMCQDCFVLYKKKYNSDVLECPICKTKGQYIKYVQPKFA